MASKIFISYRRDDTDGTANLLYRQLNKKIGREHDDALGVTRQTDELIKHFEIHD